jgi:acetyltransferase-like isoleucine patch superfamily enzyme
MFNSLSNKIRRAETPFFRALKRPLLGFLPPKPPQLPRFTKPVFRLLYELQIGIKIFSRALASFLIYHPLIQGRMAEVGKGVMVEGLPHIMGPVEIYIGNNVSIGGNVSIFSGGPIEKQRFEMQDNSIVGWNTSITIGQEVVIEEHAFVSYDCRISDNAAHPRQADLRAAGAKISAKEIRPVRIGKYAWIGNGTHILRGVTIGEGAVIGPNSVVISDIPAYCLAMGNPAEVIMKNYGKPAHRTPPPGTPAEPSLSLNPSAK